MKIFQKVFVKIFFIQNSMKNGVVKCATQNLVILCSQSVPNAISRKLQIGDA